jgi:hypothetical protein
MASSRTMPPPQLEGDVFRANCGVVSPKLDDFRRKAYVARAWYEGAPREGKPPVPGGGDLVPGALPY